MKLLWLSDLHFDRVDARLRQTFYERLREAIWDAAVITGDISVAGLLPTHLSELAETCAPRKIFFVLGNHDFYGTGFRDVDHAVAECCRKHPNLRHLGQEEIITLSEDSALIGHRGWADGRAWGGRWSGERTPDQDLIRDMRYVSTFAMYRKMGQLGRESGDYFRALLPRALSCHRKLLIATHVPPFAEAVRFNGRPCEPSKLPHFVNASAGGVIKRIGEYFSQTRITVLCGHSHHSAKVRISPNLEVRVGGVRSNCPTIQDIFEI